MFTDTLLAAIQKESITERQTYVSLTFQQLKYSSSFALLSFVKFFPQYSWEPLCESLVSLVPKSAPNTSKPQKYPNKTGFRIYRWNSSSSTQANWNAEIYPICVTLKVSVFCWVQQPQIPYKSHAPILKMQVSRSDFYCESFGAVSKVTCIPRWRSSNSVSLLEYWCGVIWRLLNLSSKLSNARWSNSEWITEILL